MKLTRTLVWFRGKDLRLADHAPLHAALEGGEVIPLFVLDPYFFAPERARRIPHRIQFLIESLTELEASIAALGSRLVIAEGKSVDVVPRLARAFRVDRVVAQRWCAPFARERDRRISEAVEVPFDLFDGESIATYGSIRTKTGQPFLVFTPFARALTARIAIAAPLPLARPRKLPPLPSDIRARRVGIPTLSDLGITPNPRVLRGGESAARQRLTRFLAAPIRRYDIDRDRMDLDGTSRLSADLKFGTVSPRTVWARAERAASDRSPAALRSFLNELVWRELTHATLWDRPEIAQSPFRPDWEGFPYVRDQTGWRAWELGKTGYPVVDASARQLLGEGFVHNRARMISASFLTKHLLIDWRRGEAHYMDKLTDGDWASNLAGWQWSAGCGCDAQPYFRVFNPVTQGERFDPEGDYVRKWVPELERMPAKFIHRPWEAPSEVLRAAGVRLGSTYPAPILDHAAARARFLALAKAHLRKAR